MRRAGPASALELAEREAAQIRSRGAAARAARLGPSLGAGREAAAPAAALSGPVEFVTALSKSFLLITLRPQPSCAVRDIVVKSKDGWSDPSLAALTAAVRERLFVQAFGQLEPLALGGHCLHPQSVALLPCLGGSPTLSLVADPPGTAREVPPAAAAAAAETQPVIRVAEQRDCRRKRPRGVRGNRRRAQAFARFLIDTFGKEKLNQGRGVLDVAGGSGELVFELCVMHGIRCCTLDPRPVKLSAQQSRAVRTREEWISKLQQAPTRSPLIAQLLSEWLTVAPEHLTGFLYGREDVAERRAVPETMTAVVTEMQEATGGAAWIRRCDDPESMGCVEQHSLAGLLLECSAVVGLHPDQPTGCIVDCATAGGKPWAVIPCCVFPDRYRHRRTCGHCDRKSKCSCADGECAEVRSHPQLVEHLQHRAAGRAGGAGRVSSLEFGGRNLVVYGGGEIS